MEKILNIDGQEVPFKASGATTRIYRAKFGRDIFADMENITKSMAKGGLERANLEMFEDIAYVMAYQADKSIPPTPDEWLDQFGIFSIYQILPELLELWGLNTEQIEEPKKKADEQSGN